MTSSKQEGSQALSTLNQEPHEFGSIFGILPQNPLPLDLAPLSFASEEEELAFREFLLSELRVSQD